MTLEDIQNGRRGPFPTLARAGLTILSWGWGSIQSLKSLAYATGLRRSTSLGRPVVSIGNLIAGGAGKTPMVIALAHALRARGRTPGVLARGYRRAPGAALNDEGLEIARAIEDIAQVQDPDRVAAAKRLLFAHPTVDVILLDDGFQHRRVARSLDVVLLDALDPFGGGRLLPRGRLRERPSALSRADAVVLTRCDLCDARELDSLEGRVRVYTEAPVYRARTEAVAIWDGATEHAPTHLQGKTVHLAAGVARPDAVRRTLEALGATVTEVTPLPDHARLELAGWQTLVDTARSSGADALIATRKDAVKLAKMPDGVWVLDVRTALDPEFIDLVDRRSGSSPTV